MTSLLLALVIDESGSMLSRACAVEEAINSLLDGYRQDASNSVRLATFSGHQHIRHRKTCKAVDAPRLVTSGEHDPHEAMRYAPAGNTALFDALTEALDGIERETKKSRPERILVAIMTDGEENDSRKTTAPQLRDRIEKLRAAGDMEFIFLGADIDSFTHASRIGIPAKNAAIYANTNEGTQHALCVMDSVTRQYKDHGAILGLGRVIPEKERKP